MSTIALLALTTTATTTATIAVLYARRVQRETRTRLNALQLDIARLRGQHANTLQATHPPGTRIPTQRRHP